MIHRELYAVCDFCGKRVLLPECYSISTYTYSWIRKKLGWQISRKGKFLCDYCKNYIH